MRGIEEDQPITAWENKEENTAYDDVYYSKFSIGRMETHQIKVVTIDNKKKIHEVKKCKTKHSSTKLFHHTNYLQQQKEALKRYLDQRDLETKKSQIGQIKQSFEKNEDIAILSHKQGRVQNKTIIFDGFPDNNPGKNDIISQNKLSLFSGSTSKKYKRKFIYYEGHKQTSSLIGFQSELPGKKQFATTVKPSITSKILLSEPDKHQKLRKILKFPLFYRQIGSQAHKISRNFKHKSSIDIPQKDSLPLFTKNSFQFQDDNLFSSKIIRY